jgi:hypothetical protein
MIYFFTGKLGAGKTLVSVGKIKEYLVKGKPVATNLDLHLDKLIGKDSKKCRVVRLPDHPQASDLKLLGKSYIGPYDENKFGLIVLDECGTWFNSRTWNDKARQEVIDTLLHIRKNRWDVIFLIQDISMVDKQAREGTAELVGFCRRLDRLTVPLIGPLVQVLTGIKITLPRMHLCIVKYGYSMNSIVVERFVYKGTELYKGYDTEQEIVHNQPFARGIIKNGAEGAFSYLPPWYYRGRHRFRKTVGNYMNLTKIVARKYNRVACFIGGVAFSMLSLVGVFAYNYDFSQIKEESPVVQVNDDFLVGLSDYKIDNFAKMPGRASYYVLSKGKEKIDSKQLESMGYTIKDGGRYEVTIVGGSKSVVLYGF